MANMFYCIIWSVIHLLASLQPADSISCRPARLSILFSMIRIDPSETRRRRLMFVAVAFFVVWVTLVAQLFWVCEPNASWKLLKTPQCPLGEQVAVFQLVCECHQGPFCPACSNRFIHSGHHCRFYSTYRPFATPYDFTRRLATLSSHGHILHLHRHHHCISCTRSIYTNDRWAKSYHFCSC
jgi:hypothetical protein